MHAFRIPNSKFQISTGARCSRRSPLYCADTMGFFSLLYPWGLMLQALAMVHFIRRRPDTIYRRGIAEIHLGDFEAAVRVLQTVTSRDPKYDLHRAIALLAHAYANAGQSDKADALFRQATEISTLSETYFNYAMFLASQQRTAEARDWAQRILAKKPTMPRYLQRRERPWFRKARALLKRLP